MLQCISFDIDSTDAKLTPAKEIIKPNSRVGFDSNVDSIYKYSLYYSAKSILAPHLLLLERNLDTVLAFQLKSTKLLQFPGYNVVYKAEDKQRSILLLIKKK